MMRTLLVLGFSLFSVVAAAQEQASVNPFAKSMVDFKLRVDDYMKLRDQITKTMSNAKFNGINLIDGSLPGLEALANADGNSRLTVAGQNLSLGGTIAGEVLATEVAVGGEREGNMLATLRVDLDGIQAEIALTKDE